MPDFNVVLKVEGDYVVTADSWYIDGDKVFFVAAGEAGKTDADPVAQSRGMAAVVMLSELAAIIKAAD
jgi:hypothetical protein